MLSLMDGWTPIVVQIVTAAAIVRAVLARPRRHDWPGHTTAAVVGLLAALAAHWLLVELGVTGEPAPARLWVWIGLSGFALTVTVARWAADGWVRRRHGLFATSFCLLSVGLVVNGWIGYYPTLNSAWNHLTDAAVPGETDWSTASAARGGPLPERGVVVRVDIDSAASGFDPRSELVYLPPAWFTANPPPPLPAIMMIGGQFNDPADWLRVGDAYGTLDGFAARHRGHAPIAVFVDPNGTFANDTECVNGSRGRASDHLVLDVVPQIARRFGVAVGRWGSVGFSSGGTCAVDLAVMHPETFGAFVDIAGDEAPNAGTRRQTVERLFGGDENAYAAYDPATVMGTHGPYRATAGLFAVPAGSQRDLAAATALCDAGRRVNIECAVTTTPGRHVWPFAATAFADALPWLARRLEESR